MIDAADDYEAAIFAKFSGIVPVFAHSVVAEDLPIDLNPLARVVGRYGTLPPKRRVEHRQTLTSQSIAMKRRGHPALGMMKVDYLNRPVTVTHEDTQVAIAVVPKRVEGLWESDAEHSAARSGSFENRSRRPTNPIPA